MGAGLRFALSTFLAVLGARSAAGQARVVSAPPEPSLLTLTTDWGRASTLGDLRARRSGPEDLELRVWGGFGFGATQGVVLRRSNGHWSVYLARVRRCAIQIPIVAGDTASRATMQAYVADARRRCDTPLTDVGAGMRVITADTLAVDALALPDSAIEAAWQTAVRAGVLQLPARVERSRPASTDFTYVVELRRGAEYRASQIEHVEAPESPGDRQVQQIYAAMNAILPAELQVRP